MDLDGKVVVVTGGGRGIGRGIALRLAKAGARLALLDLNDSDMAETVSQVEAEGSQARAYNCNITEEALVESTFTQIVEDFGVLHGLVNNAGVLRDGLLVKVKDGEVVKKMSGDEFSFVVDVHMKGAFLCAREAAVKMIEQKVEEGVIVNMSSGAFRGNLGQTNYSGAKAGMVAMNRVWGKELGRYNIRSMAIAPGMIKTDMLMSMPADALNKLASAVPVGRIAEVDNIAHTVQHIFENDYLSGDVIDISGGMYI